MRTMHCNVRNKNDFFTVEIHIMLKSKNLEIGELLSQSIHNFWIIEDIISLLLVCIDIN